MGAGDAYRGRASGYVAAIFLTLSGAGAQEPRERADPEFKPRLKQVAPGRCQQQTCDWFSIESADYLGASEKGWLFTLDDALVAHAGRLRAIAARRAATRASGRCTCSAPRACRR